MLETTGSEQQEPPLSWSSQFRDEDEITMYLYIAGLIRVLRSNAAKIAVAQELYCHFGHGPVFPPKRHWYSKRLTPITYLNPRYSFADVMSIVDALVHDLPAGDWPSKIDMVKAYPAMRKLARHTPDRYKPPEYNLQRQFPVRGKGERYMLDKLRTAYDESFPPGVRL